MVVVGAKHRVATLIRVAEPRQVDLGELRDLAQEAGPRVAGRHATVARAVTAALHAAALIASGVTWSHVGGAVAVVAAAATAAAAGVAVAVNPVAANQEFRDCQSDALGARLRLGAWHG